MAIDSKRVLLKYVLPLNEIVMDFHDTLKSLSSGYASFDYEEYEYEPTSLAKVFKFMKLLNLLMNKIFVLYLCQSMFYFYISRLKFF